jgi:CelD/BcsL family acetyltransferase involved in cellulose biosynthesis
MRVTEIEKFSDFLALQQEWTKILQLNNQTIFQTWEWLSTWWKHFGKGRRLLVLLAEDDGEICGIAPLMYSIESKFGVRQGIIEFIGTGHSEYNDFILSDKHQQCIKMFFDYLNNLPYRWSYAKLVDIPLESKYLPQVSNRTKIGRSILNLSLPSTFGGLSQNVKGRDRKDFRRNLRRLEENNFKVELVDYSAGNLVPKGMNMLFELHQKRWQSKGGFRGMFAEPAFCNFSLDIAKCFSAEKLLGLYCLEISGKPAAAIVGFKYSSKYYLYISGLDPNYTKFSAGNILYWLVIPKLIQEGFLDFDFGIGVDSYKRQWSPSEKTNLEVTYLRKKEFANTQYWLYDKYCKAGSLLRNRASALARIPKN